MKKLILIPISLLYIGCNDKNKTTNIKNIDNNSVISTIPETPKNDNPNVEIITCKQGKSTVIGQVLDTSGKGIPNISVEIEGCQTITDSNGTYKLQNIKENNKTYIYIDAKEYSKGITPIKIKKILSGSNDQSFNYIKTTLIKYNEVYVINSGFKFNKYHIYIPENSYENIEGEKYYGDIKINISRKNINTKENRRTFPGEFKGINFNGDEVNFKAISTFELRILDKNNNDLYLTRQINIKFHPENSLDETLSLWKFNEITYKWEEVGIAYKDENGYYLAEIDQVGIWAITKEMNELATYIGRIVYPDGEPAKNIRVYLTGKN